MLGLCRGVFVWGLIYLLEFLDFKLFEKTILVVNNKLLDLVWAIHSGSERKTQAKTTLLIVRYQFSFFSGKRSLSLRVPLLGVVLNGERKEATIVGVLLL